MSTDEDNLFDSIEGLIGEYVELLLKAVEEGLLAIKQVCEDGGYIGS